MEQFFNSVTNFFAKIGQIIAQIKGFFDSIIGVFQTLRGVVSQFADLIQSWVTSYPRVSILLAVIMSGITIIILLSIWEAVN